MKHEPQTDDTRHERIELLARYRRLQRLFAEERRATTSRNRLIELRARDRNWYWLAL